MVVLQVGWYDAEEAAVIQTLGLKMVFEIK